MNKYLRNKDKWNKNNNNKDLIERYLYENKCIKIDLENLKKIHGEKIGQVNLEDIKDKNKKDIKLKEL